MYPLLLSEEEAHLMRNLSMYHVDFSGVLLYRRGDVEHPYHVVHAGFLGLPHSHSGRGGLLEQEVAKYLQTHPEDGSIPFDIIIDEAFLKEPPYLALADGNIICYGIELRVLPITDTLFSHVSHAEFMESIQNSGLSQRQLRRRSSASSRTLSARARAHRKKLRTSLSGKT
jgi:hypothetical protein